MKKVLVSLFAMRQAVAGPITIDADISDWTHSCVIDLGTRAAPAEKEFYTLKATAEASNVYFGRSTLSNFVVFESR